MSDATRAGTTAVMVRAILFVFCGTLVAACTASARAQSDAQMERTLRDAIALYASTWNQRDIDAWATLLSNDIVNVGEYGFERRTRIAVVTYNKTVISNFDLRVHVLRLRIASDGRDATAILRLHHLGLPVQSGRYAITFDRAPVVSRWHLEEGVWRLYYLNENLKQAMSGRVRESPIADMADGW